MRDLTELHRHFHAAATGLVSIDDAADLFVGDGGRIEIYRRMYFDRLRDVLADEYPKVAVLLGATWSGVTTSYLRACPPAHGDIHQAGRGLADYFASAAQTLYADLARLEWARANVFHGPDASPLTRERLSTVDPIDFPNVHLRLIPAHAMVRTSTNADDVWSALEDGGHAPAMAPVSRVVLVWRRGTTTVVHRTLDSDEVACMALLAGGTRFSAVCSALVDVANAEARAVELLLRWIDAHVLDDEAA